MCGIAGLVGTDVERKFPISSLKHRGPDAEGEWISADGRVWLGHRRLSVLDLSVSGNQPMVCLNGRYVVVFNGEIYNFIELREELKKSGYVFTSDTDTELIPAAYDCWGADCLTRFNGMWAFALWDVSRQELFLARDRFGKKPLYYSASKHGLAFASEVQAIHRWLGNKAELDDEVLRSICSGEFAWHGTGRSYLRNVATLPAGHWLMRRHGKCTIQRWYSLENVAVTTPKALGAQADQLLALIKDSCRIRMRSDVPLATCLSGGLDSGTIAAIIHSPDIASGARIPPDHHQAFCIGFPGTMLDEADAAARLANQVGAEFHLQAIDAPDPGKLLDSIAACDGPMHSMAFYPIWRLYGFIRSCGVKVTLDGQGPDEMMGGYLYNAEFAFRDALWSGHLLRLRDLYSTYGNLGESEFLSSRRFTRAALFGEVKRPIGRLRSKARSMLVGKSEHEALELGFSHPIPKHLSAFRAGLYAAFSQNTLPTILQQYDRCSMAHGVECRMPFLDHRLVEYVFSLPETSLVGAGYTKRVLREAVRGIVPDRTRLNRHKVGFNSPIVEWFSGPLRELIIDTMRSSAFREAPYFDGVRLCRAFDSWLRAPSWHRAWAFWPPVHYVLWQRSLATCGT